MSKLDDATFEQALSVAIGKRGLNGLTFWRTHDEKWQVSARHDGSDGYTIATMTDPVVAAKIVLHGGRFDPNSELTSQQSQRLADAIGRNLRARYVPPAAPIEEEDDEL